MAIQGSLEEAGLADILQLLGLGEKTGCLSVTADRNFGHLFFREGRVVFAKLVNREDRLGERLLFDGRVTDVELAAALSEQKDRPERPLGELLVERGALGRDELRGALAEQIEETVFLLFGWEAGLFHFEPGQEPPPGDIQVSLDVAALLMEGARRADEWAWIRRRIPHRRVILARAEPGDAPAAGDRSTGNGRRAAPDGDRHARPGPRVDRPGGDGEGATAADAQIGERAAEASAQEGPDARLLLALVDGRRDVAALLSASGLEEFRALRALYDLLRAGRVVITGESPAGREQGLRRREQCRNLGFAFYRARMYGEAAREFRQILALDDSDAEACFHLGSGEFRAGRYPEALEAFSRFVELRPDVTSGYLNLALTLEALGRAGDAERALQALLRRFPRCAPGTLHHAILRYASGAYPEALALIEGVRIDPELHPRLAAVADFYRGMLHALFWDLGGARELLAGIAAELRGARVLNNLGAVLERGDRLEEARLRYAEALDLGGAAGVARKNLGDVRPSDPDRS